MAVIVRAGKLRHTAQVMTASEVADTYGEQDQVWSTDSTMHRARIEPMYGSENMIVQQMTPDVSHLVTMRYLSTLTTKNRLYVDGARTFEIVSILNTETLGHEMKLACRELV